MFRLNRDNYEITSCSSSRHCTGRRTSKPEPREAPPPGGVCADGIALPADADGSQGNDDDRLDRGTTFRFRHAERICPLDGHLGPSFVRALAPPDHDQRAS
jgi:hypothetical protein